MQKSLAIVVEALLAGDSFLFESRDVTLRFVDVHIHLSDLAYRRKIDEVVKIAKQVGVVALISNSMNLETSRLSLRLADEHPGLVYAALGIHPWNVVQLAPKELQQTIEFIAENKANKEKVLAIGEVGLDPQYAKRKLQKEQQAEVFREMLRLAEDSALPIIVHSRWSSQKIMDILPSYRLKGVLWHWFSSPIDLLPRIVERGDYVSEGPPVVFSDRIREVVQVVPLERLITETDGPVRYYGSFKDKLTTPAFIPEVVNAISRVKGIDEIQVAERILSNFQSLFDIKL